LDFTSFLKWDSLFDRPTPECLEIIQAEVLTFKGVLRFLAGSRFKAFLTFREAWKTYRKYEPLANKKSDDTLDDDLRSRVLLGLGLFHIGIAGLPRSLTAIIRIVGFSGSKDRGKAYLNACLDLKRARSPFAALILALYHIDMEPQLEKVCNIVKKMLSNFPQCALFHWVSSIISWKFAQLDDAVFFIERSLASCPPKLRDQAVFLKYEEAWFHYLKLEFATASSKF